MPKLKNMDGYNPLWPGKVPGKAGDNPKKFRNKLFFYLGVFAVLILVGIFMNIPIPSPIQNMLGINSDIENPSPIPIKLETNAYHQKFINEILPLMIESMNRVTEVHHFGHSQPKTAQELYSAQNYLKEAYLKFRSISPPEEFQSFHTLMGLALDNYYKGIQLSLVGVNSNRSDFILNGEKKIEEGISLVRTCTDEINRIKLGRFNINEDYQSRY
jgi:hypothetical protein